MSGHRYMCVLSSLDGTHAMFSADDDAYPVGVSHSAEFFMPIIDWKVGGRPSWVVVEVQADKDLYDTTPAATRAAHDGNEEAEHG